jgi:hypothetical protein
MFPSRSAHPQCGFSGKQSVQRQKGIKAAPEKWQFNLQREGGSTLLFLGVPKWGYYMLDPFL